MPGGKELVEKVRQSTKADAAEQPGWQQIERRLDLPDIVTAMGRLRGEAWEDFGHWAGIDNRTLAEWMGGKDDSAVTQAVKRLEAKMQGSRKLTKFYRALRREMSNVRI